MGLRRYRDVSEMPGPPPRPPLDSDNLRLACELARLARELAATVYPPGVRKFRSYVDLVRARERPPRG